MKESEFEDLMSKALRDDAYFDVLTSGDDREDVIDWLRNTLERVRSDRKRRDDLWRIESWQHRKGSAEWRLANEQHLRWRASSRGFEMAVAGRLRTLGLSDQGKPLVKSKPQPEVTAPKTPRPRRAPKPDALVRAHNHAEYMQSRLRLTTESLIDLAGAILDFEAGSTTIRELVANLDTLRMPHGPGEASISEVIASMGGAA